MMYVVAEVELENFRRRNHIELGRSAFQGGDTI